jgi:16S rRNA (guanine1516-N2)-methyltransferase
MPTSWNTPEVTLWATPRGKDGENAARFGLRVVDDRDPAAWQLVRAQDRMELWSPEGADALRLDLDLGNGPLARRVRQARRDDPLPRACGLHRRSAPPFVVDATAGLCRDAMVLAHLGCRVLAIERVPALAFLADAAIAGTWLAERLAIAGGDSLAWLSACGEAQRPHVVCLDPMFATAGSAQVKKDMQACRALAGPAGDDAELLRAARACATERVVVKRDPHAPPLAAGVAFAVPGERVRFDVYLAPPR